MQKEQISFIESGLCHPRPTIRAKRRSQIASTIYQIHIIRIISPSIAHSHRTLQNFIEHNHLTTFDIGLCPNKFTVITGYGKTIEVTIFIAFGLPILAKERIIFPGTNSIERYSGPEAMLSLP